MPRRQVLDQPHAEAAEGHGARERSTYNINRREFLHGTTALLASAGALLSTPGGATLAGDSAAPPTGPRKVRSIENVWIPMPDGVKIAARLWLPEDAEKHPVPAIMDYITYRKRDNTRLSDETRMPYLASFGYACLRHDIRGSGDSEGLP